MTMPAVHQNFISTDAKLAKALVELLGPLQVQNTLYAGSPNYDEEITQAEIDTVPSFLESELTTQTIADARFAMATIMNTIVNALPSLTEMSRLP